MSFHVTEFTANFTRPAKLNNFEVVISGPQELGRNEELRFKIENAEFPGRTVNAVDHSHYGPIQKVATGSVYADTQFSVLLSDDYNEAEYFNRWMDIIMGNHRNSFGGAGPSTSQTFNVAYFRDYAKIATIRGFDEQGTLKREVSLIDCYPILVSPVNLNWNSNEIARLNVTMHYRYWKDQLYAEAGNRAARFFPSVPTGLGFTF